VAKEHLIKAKELIEQGWVRTDLAKLNEEGVKCFCLDGAIAEAHGYDALNNGVDDIYDTLEQVSEVYEDVSLVFQQIVPLVQNHPLAPMFSESRNQDRERVVQSLWRYNDSIASTKEDVIAVLDAAIEKAE
jgi:hypothetical protein